MRFAFRRPGPLVAALVALLLATNAAAESADKDKPVNVEADKVTVDDKKQTSTFEGNVAITQGTLVIRGEKVVVRQDGDGFQHGTATGRPAYFKQKRQGVDEYIEGWAERIEYDAKAEKLDLFRGARMKRGADDVKGSHITYDNATGLFQVAGGSAAGEEKGRVRAVIQPRKKADEAAPAPR